MSGERGCNVDKSTVYVHIILCAASGHNMYLSPSGYLHIVNNMRKRHEAHGLHLLLFIPVTSSSPDPTSTFQPSLTNAFTTAGPSLPLPSALCLPRPTTIL